MRDFSGKIAVITGCGTGMGRELARQLIAQGCDVAMCDVSNDALAESLALCQSEAPQGVKVTAFNCDVADAAYMQAFADHVQTTFQTTHINLLFNNAGISGGGSFVKDTQAHWEKTFNVCWGGVYNGCRAFLPALLASSEGHIINTSSVNGFWATSGPHGSHTAYSAAKFAVKGFTEALITDLRINAPHIKASVVMPGHVGTNIVLNSVALVEDGTHSLARMMGSVTHEVEDDQLGEVLQSSGENFRDNAPTTAKAAATIILDGVKAQQWRILVGDDAHQLDALVREYPEEAYEQTFLDRWSETGTAST